MARDHRKLEVFHQAHRLTLAIYKETQPKTIAGPEGRWERPKPRDQRRETRDERRETGGGPNAAYRPPIVRMTKSNISWRRCAIWRASLNVWRWVG